MLKSLKTVGIGPAPKMKLDFGSRLNLLTGDNGLGKSFLLDIAWWALTRKWPAQINPKLTSGNMARPTKGEGKITFEFTGKAKAEHYTSIFKPKDQDWTGRPGRPSNPGLVLYAMSDGSFAVWDPARNYWVAHKNLDTQERQPAYVFSPAEVWDGLRTDDEKWLSNGLIRDWASWQKENGQAFQQLKKVLEVLSPSPEELLTPGELTRVSLDDVRDIPTVRMPYQQDVPVIYASSGMRRIMALAYFLVWAWQEHRQAAKLLQQPEAHQVIFLIDEVESHLHPSWQRKIVPALLNLMDSLAQDAETQLITATHSPLIMASVEPWFDHQQDAWFDLDICQDRKNQTAEVKLTRREFIRRGDASRWLTSEAFDLSSARSEEAEQALNDATEALKSGDLSQQEALQLDKRLREVLGDTDPFWMRWRFVAEQKGWLE
ncbi:ATP-binding protein [Cobetia sp. D5]|uniref:AAA family ATPase n=1 Tax=Cobetia sp. D5 TaxID=3105867 RepID=UPI002D783724|nr:ATP-binding protein [Cobetia sp. D5]